MTPAAPELQWPLTAGAKEGRGLSLEMGGLRKQGDTQGAEVLHYGDFQISQVGSGSLGDVLEAQPSRGEPAREALGGECGGMGLVNV